LCFHKIALWARTLTYASSSCCAPGSTQNRPPNNPPLQGGVVTPHTPRLLEDREHPQLEYYLPRPVPPGRPDTLLCRTSSPYTPQPVHDPPCVPRPGRGLQQGASPLSSPTSPLRLCHRAPPWLRPVAYITSLCRRRRQWTATCRSAWGRGSHPTVPIPSGSGVLLREEEGWGPEAIH